MKTRGFHITLFIGMLCIAGISAGCKKDVKTEDPSPPEGNIPVADFTADPVSGTAPLSVSFTDQSSDAPTNWQWDFGDGGTSDLQNPSHTYIVADTFTVQLTVSNAYGSDSEIKDNSIEVKTGGGGNPCPGSSTVTWQGQTYNTVQIGDQCWMKENLNWETGSSWCYNDDPANCATYGRLYTWETIMNGASSSNTVPSGVQGICPTGWHLPSDAEWCTLTQHIDPTVDCEGLSGWSGIDVGTEMKSTAGWDYDGNGTNESGFTALPAGSRSIAFPIFGLGFVATFWSSTEYDNYYAWDRSLNSTTTGVARNHVLKTSTYQSVRCVKD